MWVFCFGGTASAAFGAGRQRYRHMHRNMNARQTTPTGRAEESDRFDRHPDPAVTFRFADEGDLERLKNDLLRPLLAKATAADLILQLHRAAN